MSSTAILSTYLRKLNHPIKEIRERSLQLLVAKLRMGWQHDDELAFTREMFEGLLAWFHVQHPSLQREALDLLLSTLKTKTGSYIAKEFGIKKILSSLNRIRDKIDIEGLEVYNDLMETLRFLNTVESEDNINVPHLVLTSVTSQESGECSSNGYYNEDLNCQTSKETSISNEDVPINKLTYATDGIKVLLFPWVELCSSDTKTILMVEDALKLLKSTRRCCRFIRDVFLRDFPAEIFLNRPTIIKNLIAISDGQHGGRPLEALQVLLCITRTLRTRLSQLNSLELMHEYNKLVNRNKEHDNGMNTELEHMIGDDVQQSPREDDLVALRQLPAPIYALDTLHAMLSAMMRNIVEPYDKQELLNLKELNSVMCLVESLTQLLLDCVDSSFWCTDHQSRTDRDIAHKSCMVMRLLGDLLTKYRKSFSEDSERIEHRVIWLRLVFCAEKFFHWARSSALPPTSLVVALQAAQLDPALDLLYPELSKRISDALQDAKTSIDQEYKSKYRELSKLCECMKDAVLFIKDKSINNPRKLLKNIKNSLPVLELHLSESYLNKIADILLVANKDEFTDNDWNISRSISLCLMAHHVEWVQAKFYRMIADMVKSVLIGENSDREVEKNLTLLCDVGMLTEICCHGLSSKSKEVEASASDIMLYLLRGRLVLSDSCWWRLLASLLPVLPLLHVYAEHDTPLGKAICKSLEPDIADCMGVPLVEVVSGLVRLMFVRCVAVQLDAAHSLCRLLDDDKYLPPRESLRTDILLNALRRVEPQDFNVDLNSSPSKTTQTTGITQILDVLKQDIVLDEHGTEFVTSATLQPMLEPSLRRSTLQQLSVMIRQQDLHNTFLECDGLKVIVTILRMSLMVDDYLAFPECAISCVSILNSVCFTSRHNLAKIQDLPLLLIRVILVFPANESAVLLCAQILALVSWSGFALQELDSSRHWVPALPLSVTQRTTLPFTVSSYWSSSSNAEHSSVEWLLADEEFRATIRVRWWCAYEGGTRVLRGASPPPSPLSLRPSARDLALLRAACPLYCCTKALLAIENATGHRQVVDALCEMESYTHLLTLSSLSLEQFVALPWQHLKRYLGAPPASSRDANLLLSLLHFVIWYMDKLPCDGITMSWIKSSFIGQDATIISLLGRDQLYPQQTIQEDIEVTQLHIHIIKVLLRCVIMLERDSDYDSNKMESLLKILLVCLERVDLRNFHMLGYLNELLRCIRYILNSRFCKLSEDTLIQSLKLMTNTLTGCASGAGRKGQACRLDAMLSLLALLRQINDEGIPVQRWSEAWNSDVVCAVVCCGEGSRAELRAAALHVMSVLAHYTQMLPQLLQAIPESSLSEYAVSNFAQSMEANVVRTAAASLLTSITVRASPHSDVLESDVLEQLRDKDFLGNCLEILVDFCNERKHNSYIEPNVPVSVLERRTELEVRAQKSGDVRITPSLGQLGGRPPPTAALVIALADVLHNVVAFSKCPIQSWNERGLYRLLFRCASWSNGTSKEGQNVRAATCRAIVAATKHKGVRSTLAATNDCLYELLSTLKPLDEDDWDLHNVQACTQGLLLLASLVTEPAAYDNVWRALRDNLSSPFFHLLLQCLQSDEIELQDASLYCLTQLAQSTTHKKHPDRTKDDSYIELFDNLKCPVIPANKFSMGDVQNDDCYPEYMAEEMCKILMRLFQKLTFDNTKPSPDDRFCEVCSCLSSVLAISARSRLYAVHRQFPRVLLATLQGVRDNLSLQGKSADVIRNASNNPALRTLVWLLIVINSAMIECTPAKEAFAEDNIAASLNRLWPWCMMTDQLRDAVLRLLLTFTNDCAKACGSMAMCVGGRSLIGEVCALVTREAALQSRPRPDTLLLLCLNTLRHTANHHHCRTLILKSDALSCMYKLRVRERVRGSNNAAISWARLCERIARYSDGAGTIVALSPLIAASSVRPYLMPAIAHVAHYHRTTFLQSQDLLELLSGTLLAGDTVEVIAAARAVWALAANNHKAKLLLRSAGVAAAIQSALNRIYKQSEDPASQRALQLLTYTNRVLQAT